MLESAVPCGQAFKYKAEGSVPTLIATIVLEGGEEMLRIALDNVTPEGRPVLTPTECAAVFQQGAKGPSASARSHGIGLGTVKAAAKAVGGRATLQSYQDGSEQAHVVYCIMLPITRVGHDAAAEGGVEQGSDNTTMAKSETVSPPLSSFSTSSSKSQTPPPSELLGPRRTTDLICVGCDDSSLMRPLMRAAFEKLGASRVTVLGANGAEIMSVVDVVLGGAAEGGRQADIVLLDVNLDVNDRPFANGADMAEELRRRGFTGFIALYTAGTAADLRRLIDNEQANCVIMKSLQGPPLHERLRESYDHFCRAQPALHSVNEEGGALSEAVHDAMHCAVERREQLRSPPMDSSLLQLEHMQDIPEAIHLAFLKDLFDATAADSMPQMLDMIEERIAHKADGVQINNLVHRLIGECRYAGAVAMAAQLEAFEQEPSYGAIAEMRVMLDATKKALLNVYPDLGL